MKALAGYVWHSQEPLYELILSDNRTTDAGVEELLRCLYNQTIHPPRMPGASGEQAFPLRLELRNNWLQDSQALVKRVESAGSAGAVQLVATPGDGPAPFSWWPRLAT